MFIVMGHNHFGHTDLIGVEAFNDEVLKKLSGFFQDPDLYLSSVEVFEWIPGEDKPRKKYNRYSSNEDSRIMRENLEKQKKADKERRERNQLASLQRKYPDASKNT
jgi:hypothetical protein